jgi:putative transposase
MRNQRKDFHHKQSRRLVNSYSALAVEALSIDTMVRRPRPQIDEQQRQDAGQTVYAPNGATAKSGLNKSISDAGWGQFLTMLATKAEWAGSRVVVVEPAGTSQVCSGCGEKVPKGLEVRWHQCPHCGLSLSRDHNAARNILYRAGLVPHDGGRTSAAGA